MNRQQSTNSIRNKKMQTRRKRRRASRLQMERERAQKFIDSILSTPTLQKEVMRDVNEKVVSKACDSDFEVLTIEKHEDSCIIC